jgi:outer membrane protein TolC
MKKLLASCLILPLFLAGIAQKASDTLTLDAYLKRIKCCHPLAKTADLNLMIREFNTLAARGGFDPQAEADFNRKMFEDKTYFQHLDAGLSGFILPGGIGYQAGYELNSGLFLNPEQRNPQNGLFYAGINVPLLQGMITDQRRTALRQAQTMQESGEEERRLALNELLFNAYVKYMYWSAYHDLEALYLKQVELTLERLENIRNAVSAGDRAAIDTADARAMLANWEMGLAETRALKIKYGYQLFADLWNDDGTPMNMEEPPIPGTVDETLFPSEDLALLQSPVIRVAELKTEWMRLEKRLKAEYIKPKLNLKYNFLYGNPQVNNAFPVFFENYKAGINFSMPLLLRAERGAYRAAEAKWKIARLEQDFKITELDAKLKGALAEIIQNGEASEQADQLASFTKRLAEAEQERFDAGDSNFFNLFLRESNFVNAAQKRIKATAEYRISRVKPKYVLGQLAD